MKKLLRNRFFVAGLVVVALGSVFFNSRKELRRALGPRFAAGRKATPTPAANAVPATPAAPLPALPTGESTLRREVARNRMERWLQAPDRDPFAFVKPVSARPSIIATAKPDAFQVSAIWRQAGQQFAVINGKVLREGEEAFGYTVERIENGAIFLRHPANGEVRAEFPAFDRLPGAKTAPATAGPILPPTEPAPRSASPHPQAGG